MREILFRGKRKDNGEWVDGDLIHYDKDDMRILPQNERCWDILESGDEVIPGTVGQYTGLKDINGNNIFEGDVVDDFFIGAGVVIFDSGIFKAVSSKKEREFYLYPSDRLEIIGNIHDNPELLNKI